MKKIVCISDTHGKHNQLTIPDGDILIHAGDVSSIGTVEQVCAFNKWLGTLPHKHKIICAGNHDAIFDKKWVPAKYLITNATYLEDSFTIVDGIKIYGSPYSPEFCNWYFGLPRGEPLKQKWAMIPEDTDILVTHGPPAGILDLAPEGKNVGCVDLLKRIEEIRPRYSIFGHIHGQHGQLTYGHITYINASMLDEMYMPGYDAIVVEWRDSDAKENRQKG